MTDISRLQLTEVEPCERSSRLFEVLQKWGWERLSKSRFRTPSGVLDLLSHGETSVTAAMKAAWKRQLWLSEPRAAEVADLNVEPVIAVHVACMKQGQKQDPLSFSIACAAGPASRKLAKRFDLNHVSCVCVVQTGLHAGMSLGIALIPTCLNTLLRLLMVSKRGCWCVA